MFYNYRMNELLDNIINSERARRFYTESVQAAKGKKLQDKDLHQDNTFFRNILISPDDYESNALDKGLAQKAISYINKYSLASKVQRRGDGYVFEDNLIKIESNALSKDSEQCSVILIKGDGGVEVEITNILLQQYIYQSLKEFHDSHQIDEEKANKQKALDKLTRMLG